MHNGTNKIKRILEQLNKLTIEELKGAVKFAEAFLPEFQTDERYTLEQCIMGIRQKISLKEDNQASQKLATPCRDILSKPSLEIFFYSFTDESDYYEAKIYLRR